MMGVSAIFVRLISLKNALTSTRSSVKRAPSLPLELLPRLRISTMSGYKWVRNAGARHMVPGMVVIGRDLDGANLVVGRAHHQGDLIPAKVKPEHGVAYVAYGGTEHAKHDYEILVKSEFTWVHSGHGHVPPGAVEAGRTANGEVLFVGRVYHQGVPSVGKVHPSHGSLYIPYNGEEIPYKQYEVLVQH